MKRIFFVLLVAAIAAAALPAASWAATKYAGVEPAADQAGNVTIPQLPLGTLVEVVVWNDNEGTTRKLGAVSNFKLNPGDGFNFQWRDQSGKVWWQLVTQSTQATGLTIDPWVDPKDGRVKCKYLKK